MKIFNHLILVILVIGGLLFIARDDVKSIYNRVLSYVSDNIKNIDTAKIKDSVVIAKEKILNNNTPVNTPGVLKSESSLVFSANSVKLSVQGVIEMTNQNRFENGKLSPLKENSKLDSSAQKKLEDMLKLEYFEHVSPSGVSVSDLVKGTSYEYIIISENLALGNFRDNKALLDAWMASPGHRANILNNKYTEIGVAVGHGMYQGRDTWIAVQHFGAPKSSCPSINEIIRGSIKILENNIKSMDSDLATRKQRIDSGVVYEGKTPNEQVTEYNNLVVTYNDSIKQLKEKIDSYNASVKAFNSCLSSYLPAQATSH
jgi:uncharacterized protein YkwD